MSRPPKTIDGADVLDWAWSGLKPFGFIHNESGEVASEIFGLALCKYPNSSRIYRFSCDINWETEQDSDYKSVAEAKLNIPEQYQLVEILWSKPKLNT